MTNQTETKKKLPSHILYLIEPQDGQEKDLWTNIGAMWLNNDGKGFNLKFEYKGETINLTARKFIPRAE